MVKAVCQVYVIFQRAAKSWTHCAAKILSCTNVQLIEFGQGSNRMENKPEYQDLDQGVEYTSLS